jgi:histidine ammonia-lyase
MGWSAGRKLRTAVEALARVLAVEMVAATRALEIRTYAGGRPAPATAAVLAAVREAGVPGPGRDRYLSPDLEAAYAFLRSGGLVRAAEAVTGPLE